MKRVTAVRLRLAGKNAYYDAEDYELQIGDKVLVETDRGIEIGEISIPVMEVEEENLKGELKHIDRPCTKDDLEQNKENRAKETEAYEICRQKIREHGLQMKLIRADYTFDRRKLTFYFSAEGRVDFRALVKDLASEFRTRIELRQIGVRDETRILGGLGVCGRPLCCRTYLTDFSPVSIKMAKEQNLSLNPTKISGLCGRLMCCLNNEEETYEYLNKNMPRRGDAAVTPDGDEGTVYNVNILRQRVAVLFEKNDMKEVREFSVDELDFAPKGSRELVPKPKKENSGEAETPILRDNYQAAVKAAIERNSEEKVEREEREKNRRERGERKGYQKRNDGHGGNRRNGKKYEGNRPKKNGDYRRKGNTSSDEQWDEYNGRGNRRFSPNQNRKKQGEKQDRPKQDRPERKVSNGGYQSFASDSKNSGNGEE